jgi:hypothetical protein
MVLPVHLRLSAVVAIMDCPDRCQFIGSPSLKQAALQSIWLFQESLSRAINFLPHCLVLIGFDLQRYFLQKFVYRFEHPVSVGASCRKAGCQSLNPSVSNLL